MGSCFSSTFDSSAISHELTIKVITINGYLREYSSEIRVYEALGHDHPSCFICDSDELSYDRTISPMATQALLQLGQLYFVLPVSKLQHVLTGQEMAALAVKASLAFEAKKRTIVKKRKYMQSVMPVRSDEAVKRDVNENVDGLKRFNGEFRSMEENKRMIVMKQSVYMRRKIKIRLNEERLGSIQEDGY